MTDCTYDQMLYLTCSIFSNFKCLVMYFHILLLFAISEKRVDQNNRVYFVNHKNRTTQWEDPRIQGYAILL